jgi:hypothetical protein
MTDLAGDNTPRAFFAHPGAGASPGRQLIGRVFAADACSELNPLDKVFRQLQKQKHGCGGFYHKTSGIAAVFLDLLRDPRTRKDFLRLTRVSPENFRSDEDCARALAVGWMVGNLAKMFEAEFNKRFGQFCHERRKAQRLHELGHDYEQDVRRHVYMALAHLEAARSAVVLYIVLYTGWSLERDFSGLRAPRLVAELVTHAAGLTSKITERQVRYLCRWIKRRA